MRSRITGVPAGPHADELVVGAWLQAEESRGRSSVVAAGPHRQPRLEHRYLTAESDRRRLRDGVRLAVELLRSRALAPSVGALTGRRRRPARRRGPRPLGPRPPDDGDPPGGHCPDGPEGDPGSVVDQWLQVRDVAGLRVVDTSVMPTVTTRGPAAIAVMLGQRAAELVLGG